MVSGKWQVVPHTAQLADGVGHELFHLSVVIDTSRTHGRVIILGVSLMFSSRLERAGDCVADHLVLAVGAHESEAVRVVFAEEGADLVWWWE